MISSILEGWPRMVKAPVPKTGSPQGVVSSNLTPSATSSRRAFLRFLSKGSLIAAAMPFVPAKTFFDMGNLKRPVDRFTFADWITQETLPYLRANLALDRYSEIAGRRMAEEFDINAVHAFWASPNELIRYRVSE